MNCTALERIKSITERNVLNLQAAKAAGRPVVGEFCIYSPMELAMAAGAIPVSLCGTKNDAIPAAETVLPRSICPLIKSSFGFALQDSCPYLAASDLIVGDTTCDGKKKMFELLGRRKPLFLLQLPQTQDADALAYWRAQYVKLLHFYEERFHTVITEERLRASIRLMNRFRTALKRVYDSAMRDPAPLSGMELLECGFRLSFMADKELAVTLLEELDAELQQCDPPAERAGRPRILLTGVPTGMGSHKLIHLLENCGASVVCIDNCSAYKKTRLLIDEEKDPLTALAERYLETPCAVMSPNPRRYETLRRLARDFRADGIVDLTWQGCQTYEIEAHSVKTFARDDLGLPFLHVVTDYSSTDVEQLKVRVEAFLEMIG